MRTIFPNTEPVLRVLSPVPDEASLARVRLRLLLAGGGAECVVQASGKTFVFTRSSIQNPSAGSCVVPEEVASSPAYLDDPTTAPGRWLWNAGTTTALSTIQEAGDDPYEASPREIVLADPSGGLVQVALPNALGLKADDAITVKNVGATRNPILVSPHIHDSIDHSANFTLAAPYGAARFVPSGHVWMVVADYEVEGSYRTEYYVDPVNGRDDAEGDPLSPLRTLSETFRRLHGKRIKDYVTIYLLGDTEENVSYDLFVDSNFNAGVVVQGTRSLKRSGSISAIQNFDQPTKKNQIVTDSSLPTSWTASDLVGGLVVLTSNDSGCSFVLADLGSKQAVMQPFVDPYTFASVNPVSGTSFDVFGVTKISGAACGNVRGGFVEFIDCWFSNIDGDSFFDPLTHTGGYLYLFTCRVSGNDPHPADGYGGHLIVSGAGSIGLFTGCLVEAHMRALTGGQIRIFGMGFTGWGTAPTADEKGSTLYVDGPCSGYGEQTYLQSRNGGKVEVSVGAWYAAFAQTTGGPVVGPGGECNVYGMIWGAGITGVGFQVTANATMLVYQPSSLPTHVNNTVGPTYPTTQANLGGVSKTFAVITTNLSASPATMTLNADNGARVVPYG